jgi:hypothetical protein
METRVRRKDRTARLMMPAHSETIGRVSRKLERGLDRELGAFVRKINFLHHFLMLGQDYAF